MTFPEHPALIVLLVVLSLISFVMTYAGLKSRNLVWALYGVAAGLPTINLTSWGLWIAAAALLGLARWIRYRV